MIFAVETAALKSALAISARVVEPRNTIPILSNVRLKAEGGRLEIIGTDLDIQARVSIPADIEAAGEITVSARAFSDLVSKAAGALSSVRLEADRLVYSGGRSESRLPTLPADDFPLLKPLKAAHSWDVPADELARDMARVAPCMSDDPTRYYLRGILFQHAAGTLRMAATDGHRLGLIQRERPEAEGMADSILDSQAVKLLVRLLPKPGAKPRKNDPASVHMAFNRGTAAVMRGQSGPVEWEIQSKLVDGTFPDYSRAIPSANPVAITVDSDALLETAQAVTAISSERLRILSLVADGGALHLGCVDVENGVASDIIPATMTESGYESGFNARYLMDFAKMADGARLTLRVSDPEAPIRLEADGAPEWLGVLMPVRLGRAAVRHNPKPAAAPERQAHDEPEPAAEPEDEPEAERPEEPDAAPVAEIPPAGRDSEPEAATMPPEPVSALDGAESATVAASEPEAPAAPLATDGIAAGLRQLADQIAELEARLADAETRADIFSLALQQAAQEVDDWHEIASQNAARVDSARRDADMARQARRRALLSLREKRAAYSRDMAAARAEWAGMKGERDNLAAARIAQKDRADAAESECAELRAMLEQATAPATPTPEPEAVLEAAPAPADTVAQARAIMRRLGIPPSVAFVSANPAVNVRVGVAA